MVKTSKAVRRVQAIAEEYGRLDDIEFVLGSRHIKVMLNGSLITVLPRGNRSSNGHGMDNNIAEVRRALKGK